MQIPFSPPDVRDEDIDLVVQVLKSGWITSGPIGEEFRHELTEYCDSGDTLLVNSATAGLETALRLLGVGPGDEVIVPAYTYTASAAVIAHVGATIRMVDTAPGSYFVAPETWVDAVTDRTKAIIPVDLAGVPVDVDAIRAALLSKISLFSPRNRVQEAIARVAVIVDGAHSLGAKRAGLHAGNIGDFTAFSFHAVKNLTTAEGGALTWRKGLPVDHDELMRLAKMTILHGQSKSALEKSKIGSWEYDIAFPGYKMNMPDITAALGLSQLRRYDSVLDRRRQIVEAYDAALLPLGFESLAHVGEDWESSRHLYMLSRPGWTEADRNAFIVEMAKAGVSCNVHYKPLPMLTAYRDLGFDIRDYPNAYAQYEKMLTLPLHTVLTDEQVQYVTDTAASIVS
ncbi:MAG: DegT/DnrJ/EryC1/StrS family aminotransferase [Actinomycetaceae bacterium]|nr:DegT/DnrJ/EryC1/StrS family aminotransferase [Actinomycetaceae bacterium]